MLPLHICKDKLYSGLKKTVKNTHYTIESLDVIAHLVRVSHLNSTI